MTDVFSPSKRSEVMKGIKSRGNKTTEVRMASLLRRSSLSGWRRHYKLPGRPDFAFLKSKLAIFVDGCFWHGCRQHIKMPSHNKKFWAEKIQRNRSRHGLSRRRLKAIGWKTLRVWEHELPHHERRVLEKILKALSE